MGALTELSALLAENAELRAEKVPLLASLCPPAELLAETSSSGSSGGGSGGGATITGRHLNGILAIAQFLAHSEGGQHREQLLAIVLGFLRSVPWLKRSTFWPSSYATEAAKEYFPELLGYVGRISSVDSGASLDVSGTVADIVERVSAGGVGSIEGLLANSNGAKAFLLALAHNCPSLHLQDADRVIRCVLEHWIQAAPVRHSGAGRNGGVASSSPETSGSQQRSSLVNGKLNSLKTVLSVREPESGASKKGRFEDGRPDFVSPGTPRFASREVSPFSTPKHMSGELSPVSRSGLISVLPQDEVQSRLPSSENAFEGSPGYRVHQRKFEIQSTSGFERQEIAYLLLSRTLETTDADGTVDNLRVQQLRAIAVQQLGTLLPLLKIRRRDWPGDVLELKLKLGKMLHVSQAATILLIKCIKRLESEGKLLKAALRESLPVMMDVADACNSSAWRRSRPCGDLFDTLITGVAQVTLLHMGNFQRVLLRYKTCVTAACGHANDWGTTLGPAFESLVKGLCILIEAGWKTDRGVVESFLLSLAGHLREKDPVEKGHRQAYVAVQMNVVSFLGDLCVSLDKSEIVELILPIYAESLEEGDASAPSLVRLKLLEAVGRMACLGSEKSYREVVVLLTRSYLDKLSVVGSVLSRTLPAEGTTERLETIPGAFLQIARGLCQASLRANYRQRLLALCSDVGLIAEANNGRTGADLLGPLLPAVAEASVDVDPTKEVEQSLLKLYRNLWFYISLFGLAPTLRRGYSPNSKSGSQGGIFSHISSGLSQAISGGVAPGANATSSGRSMPLQTSGGMYAYNTQWAAAVEHISQGCPPLVVGSLKWLENELELSALHNLGRYRGLGSEKEVSAQRAALAAALGARVDTSSISGVSATYLLAVASLEVLRFKSSGGVVRCNSVEGLECTSALSFVFKYLENPSLSPAVHQCLVAVVQQAFSAALLWLIERRTATGEKAERRDEVVVAHACFLLRNLCHREEYVRELAEMLLNQMKSAFPQVLWNPTCLNAALSLVSEVSSPFQTLDSGSISLRSIAHQKVREWISEALVLVPCTMQGLLQEQLRRLNRWQPATGDLLSVLAEMPLDGAKTNESAGMASIPVVMVAAAAVAGVDPELPQISRVDVRTTGIISANVKSNYAGEITGMKKLYAGMGDLTISTPSYMQSGIGTRRRMSFSDSDVKKELYSAVDHMQERDGGLDDILTCRFVQQLQEYVACAEKGRVTDPVAFRETCLRSAALILSETDVCNEIQEGTSHLLRLLCWCPVHIFTPEVLETGVFVWTWILSAAPQLDSHVMAELVDAWLWTVDTKKGLFASGVENSGPAAKLQPQLIAGEPSPLPYPDPVLGIRAHRIWLGFFLDHFEAIRHGSSDQLLLISRLLQDSICRQIGYSSHPAAAGTFFTLLLFGLKFSSTQGHRGPFFGRGGEYLLADAVYRAGLSWFAVEPRWYDSNIPGVAQAEANSVFRFLQQLSHDITESFPKDGARKRSQENGFLPTNATIDRSRILTIPHEIGEIEKRKHLLLMLCQSEVDRLETWANPLRDTIPRWRVGAEQWVEYVNTAWNTDPRIALSLVGRFPGVSLLRAEVTALVQSHVQDLFDIPEALPYIVTPKAVEEDSLVLQKLPYWAPCSIISAIHFLTPPYKGHHRVLAYVLRVLEIYPPERVTFFMPQLVQSLRYDRAGLVEGYLMVAAQRSTLFAHILIWQLQGEEPPSSEDKELEKEPAADTKNNLYDIVPRVKQRIIDSFTVEAHEIFVKEFDFFDKVTSISGVLYPLPKDERRAGIRRELEKIEVEGDQLYLPTDPRKLVRGIKLDSGVPLQSAAKVPIMITFEVVDKDGDPLDIQPQACIFKVGDDCRQDVLALQVIAILRDIFEAIGLNLYLFPYGVLPTGYGRGIIEVVRNSRSRNQMGEITDGGLYEIFQQEYGPVGSAKFEGARDNFIVSSAGYAVASLLLQPKDRHNGNLLFDSSGKLVHIDFGFILETSPGGNMRFESAQFKLSHEMTQLLDPSGSMKSDQWRSFVSLCVKGYLAARYHMDAILGTVLLMVDSGLPCFSRGDPIGNLRKRFHPEMTEREAANFMIKICNDAYNKWSTTGYDLIQYLQQGIEM